MMERWLAGLLALAFVLNCASAQEKKEGEKPAPAKGKGKTPIPLVGYKAEVLRGFTLYISEESQKHLNDADFELKPMEVLDRELAGIERVMLPKMLALLRTVKIFVEWDLPESRISGGLVVARYWYDGMMGLSMLRSGKDARKANNVEILNMKFLTEKWQPGKDRDQIVILHELSHAVQFHLLAAYEPALKAAYKQAMDRGLYDNVKHESGKTAKAYAAASDKEYFAELTCSYLDRCAYFPFTREELKEHDPVGYQVMEAIWGKSDPRTRKLAGKATAKAPAKSEKPAEPKPMEEKAAIVEKDAEGRAAQKLELIQILVKNGLRDKARDRLQDLIRTYPDTEAAKKAKDQLEQLK